jgi:hypothetical protein
MEFVSNMYRREASVVAHELAEMAISSPPTWREDPPASVLYYFLGFFAHDVLSTLSGELLNTMFSLYLVLAMAIVNGGSCAPDLTQG